MQILKLLHQNNCDIVSILGNSCGDGSDGEVFEIINDSLKVMKISIIYDLNFNNDLDSQYSKLCKVLHELITEPPIICSHVYEYGKIGTFKRDCLINNKIESQSYLLHYYVMEKCFKLTEDEKKVFHTIICHEDRGIIKKFSRENLKEILFGLSRGLDFDQERVIFFYESLMILKLNHNDIHVRNIMKDSFGNYKLVDFDKVELK